MRRRASQDSQTKGSKICLTCRQKNDRPRLKQCSRCAHTVVERVLAERKRKEDSLSSGVRDPPDSLYLSLRVTERSNE